MLAQRTPDTIETIAQRAADTTNQPVGVFREFLETANEAHRSADDEQRRLMRQLANTCPTPIEATVGIKRIMGWEEE